MNRYLNKSLTVLLCLSFFVPLVVSAHFFIFPFIVPKVLLFRSLVLGMIFVYSCLLYRNFSLYKPVFTALNVAIIAFLGSFFISTFTGLDWYRSMWDNHERMLGLFTLVHYVFFYFILTSVYKEEKMWTPFLRVFLAAGSVVMVIAFMQKYVNPELLLNRGQVRVASTLGNAIYVSSYGLFLVALGLLLFFKEQKKWYRYAAIFGAGLGFLGIFAGGSRGPLLALVVFGMVYFIINLIFSQDKVYRKRIAVSFLIFFVLIGFLAAFRHTDIVKGIPAIGRLASTSFSVHGTTPRTMAWGVAYDAWKEYPVFGWGPNNFFFAFNKYYRPQFLDHGWGETWFDNAHNIVMNTLAVQGVVGLLSYLAVFVAAYGMLWRAYRQERISLPVFGVISAFLLAHFVNNLFVFENPTSYLYFFFILAYINSATQVRVVVEQKVQKKIPASFVAGSLIALLIVLVNTNINPAKANNLTLNAIRALGTGGEDPLAVIKRAEEKGSPHIDDIRSDFARTSYPLMIQFYQNKQPQIAERLFAYNYEQLKKNILLHPHDIRIHMQLYEQLLIQSQVRRNNITYLQEAETLLQTALEKSPKRQQYKFVLAEVKARLNKKDEALQLAEGALRDSELAMESWYNVLNIYRIFDEKEKIKTLLQEAETKGILLSDQRLQSLGILPQT